MSFRKADKEKLDVSAEVAVHVSVLKCPRCGRNFRLRLINQEKIIEYERYFTIKESYCEACQQNYLLVVKENSDEVFTEEFEEKLKNFEYEDKITNCKYCGKLLFRSEKEQRYDMSMGVDHDYDVCGKCAEDVEVFTTGYLAEEFPEEAAQWNELVEKYGPVETGMDLRKKNIISQKEKKERERRKALTKQTLSCARCGREELDYPPESGEFLCEYHKRAEKISFAVRGYEDGRATCDCCGKAFLATKGQIREKEEGNEVLLCSQCYYDLK